MAIGGVGSSCTITGNMTINSSRRVLDKKFNFALEDVNSGSKVNEPLVSFSNPETGESVEIHRSDVYSDDNPLYILKGKTAEGEEFERKLHAWIIDPRNCSYAELMVLNQETGNTSAADKQRKIVVGANFETFLNEPRRYSEEQTRRIMQVAFATREVKNCMEQIERELARAEEKMPDTAINEEADEGETEEE